MKKNKITTCGYFLKRLRDNDFVAIRVFSDYSELDPRKWTILIDPSIASVYVTCFISNADKDDIYFEFNDGGKLFRRNFNVKTKSMEIIMTTLIEHGVGQNAQGSSYYKEQED